LSVAINVFLPVKNLLNHWKSVICSRQSCYLISLEFVGVCFWRKKRCIFCSDDVKFLSMKECKLLNRKADGMPVIANKFEEISAKKTLF